MTFNTIRTHINKLPQILWFDVAWPMSVIANSYILIYGSVNYSWIHVRQDNYIVVIYMWQ